MDPAVPRWPNCLWRRQRAWRACRVHEGCRAHINQAPGSAFLQSRRRGGMRQRHRIRSTQARQSDWGRNRGRLWSGPVGISCTVFAKAMGARMIALDVGEERLEMARELGADFVINPTKVDPVEAIRSLTRNGWGADKSVECSSNPGARMQAIQCVRQWGSACLVGVNGSIEFEANDIILHQKNVVGSLTFSKNMQDECAHFVAERGIDVDSIFTHEFKLDEA